MDQFFKSSSNEEQKCTLKPSISMGSLIIWNVTKAMEASPDIDLKSALEATQDWLERGSRDVSEEESRSTEERRYLVCALLAWQQLGHNKVDSLHRFVETSKMQMKEQEKVTCGINNVKKPVLCPGSFISYEDSKLCELSPTYDCCSNAGPVFKLPMDTKIVMRFDRSPSPTHDVRKKATEKDLMNKINAVCCMEPECMEKLRKLDDTTAELRLRAGNLARREAKRVELLERAEAAWKDLELGYQRRLAISTEKEEDMVKHIKKMIEERNDYKNACSTLVDVLKERGETAEKEHASFTELEKEVLECTCMRQQLCAESARMAAAFSEQQCKAAQLDRDLQFKEEQTRRKVQTLKSELESMQCLSHEVERSLHAELSALREQITEFSNQLLQEDAENEQNKEELKLYREEKMNMLEDLDKCKMLCDGRNQDKMDRLKQLREQLQKLKNKVLECRCKIPMDASVEVKRTPSLAALCKCEKKSLESCSCTSLRSTLLTSLLKDLFDGLQSELGECGSQMPCHLLKCLKDSHNWEKSSTVTTNLHNYFSKLLIGELDIAIATSIEKYHARWVGGSCADAIRGTPGRSESKRVFQQRTHCLHAKLLHERSEELTSQAKELTRTETPCKCGNIDAAVYPVLVKQSMVNSAPPPTYTSNTITPAYWRRTHEDVTQIKVQLEDIKKETIKKQDLKLMQENIVKLVQRVTVGDENNVESIKENLKTKSNRKGSCAHRSVNTEKPDKHKIGTKLSSMKKKQSDMNITSGSKNVALGLSTDKPDKPNRSFKKIERSYAVNLCLCSSKNDSDKIKKYANPCLDIQKSVNKKSLKRKSNSISQISRVKNVNPILSQKVTINNNAPKNSKISGHPLCHSDIECFHKPPSNSSINKLLETLATWKCDLSKVESIINTNPSKTINENIRIVIEVENERKSDKSLNDIVPTKVTKNPTKVIEKVTDTNVVIPNTNVSKSIQFQGSMNTESEYIGAINLDNRSGYYNKSEDKKINVFNCNHCAECDYKKYLGDTTLTNTILSQNNGSLNNGQSTTKNTINQNKLKDNLPNHDETDIHSPILSQYDDGNKLPENKIKMSLQNNEQKLVNEQIDEMSSSDSINFLGVTLTNVESRKNTAEKGPKIEQKINHIENNDHATNNIQNNINYKQNSAVKYNIAKKDDVVEHYGDSDKNEIKSIGMQIPKNNFEPEVCVCSDNKSDDSQELELNTFHLIQEHLQRKLQEFKLSDCESCLNVEQVEKIFNTLLQNIKQVIAADTKNVSCNCEFQGQCDGSWHRACMLLEEYLKVKMKRAECLRLSANNSVLPNTLEKVCTLINNDFERLKQICGCKNNKDENSVAYKNVLPDKYTHILTNDEVINKTQDLLELKDEEQSSEDTSCDSDIIRNISSQITISDTDINNAIKNYNQNEHICTFKKNQGEITEITQDNCCCTQSNKVSDLFGTNEVCVNQCIDMLDKKESTKSEVVMDAYHSNPEKANHVPLKNAQFGQKPAHIGYTVDCSCGVATGSCTSPKSLITGKNDVNRLLNNKNLFQHEESYTMNAVTKKSDTGNNTDDKNFYENYKKTDVRYISHTVNCSCDVALGACSCPKSLNTGNNDMSSIWSTLTNNKLRQNDVSYMMDAVTSKPDTENIKHPNKSQENLKKNDMPDHVPYIGYTIDCSCDASLGACRCPKSLITSTNDINSTWNTLTKNNVPKEDAAYIMAAVTYEKTNTGNIKQANKFHENIHKNDMPEYIGYTVDCSCDLAVGAYTCPKSLITGDNDIYTKLINNKLPKYDHSYIMDAVTNKPNTVIKQSNKSQENINKMDMLDHAPYVGYTIDCSCDALLGACYCSKSLINDKYDINHAWSPLTNNTFCLNDLFSYIMDSVRNKLNTETKNQSNDLDDEDCSNCVNKTGCNRKPAVEFFDEIVLEDSNENYTKDLISKRISGEYISLSEPRESCCELSSCVPQNNRNISDSSNNTCIGSLNYPVRNISCGFKQPTTVYSKCDCNMVPMCHVKMLVENIENKLMTLRCTCDSLCSKICPLHAED